MERVFKEHGENSLCDFSNGFFPPKIFFSGEEKEGYRRWGEKKREREREDGGENEIIVEKAESWFCSTVLIPTGVPV